MIQVAFYVTAWLLILNALWIMYLGAHRPKKLAQMLRSSAGRRNFEGSHAMAQGRASTHLVCAAIGFFFGSFFVFSAALGFIPYEWGGINADGEFQPFRDTLAGLIAFGTAYLLVRLLIDGSEQREIVAQSLASMNAELEGKNADLETKRQELAEVWRNFGDLETDFKEVKATQRWEIRALQNDVAKLRSLVAPDVLAEEDRKAAERKNVPPLTLWS